MMVSGSLSWGVMVKLAAGVFYTIQEEMERPYVESKNKAKRKGRLPKIRAALVSIGIGQMEGAIGVTQPRDENSIPYAALPA